jgi:hypothetical protein
MRLSSSLQFCRDSEQVPVKEGGNASVNEERSSAIEVPGHIYANWQSIVDNLAALFNLPAALVMRIVDADIEVFVSSSSEGNLTVRGQRNTCWVPACTANQ